MSRAPGAGTRRAPDRRQRGSGTVLMLAVVCVAALGLVAVLMFTAVSNAGAKAGTAAAAVAAGASDGGAQAVTLAYHGALVPFCSAAARGFFQQVLAAGL